jgi:arylsulfatase A-like enzyme
MARSTTRAARVRAALWALLLAAACAPPEPSGRAVVLVSIDTLRADALSSYGNPRATTPQLDRLAKRGVRFTSAIAPSPWTLPSHASMLTALEPGVVTVDALDPLPETAVTVAERLRAAGFATGAVVNFKFLTEDYGMAQGFEEFAHVHPPKSAPRLVDTAIDFLGRHRGRDQFFFLHLFDLHAPYTQPPPWTHRFTEGLDIAPDEAIPFLRQLHFHKHMKLEEVPNLTWLRARYEAGAARVDAELGRLFDALRELSLFDDALLIVTSDHGEAFFERGVFVGHGLFLYDTELWVPLIVKFPGDELAGRAVSRLVSLVDVTPTILHVVGVTETPEPQGTSLLRIAREDGEVPVEDDPATAPAVFGLSANLGQRFVRTQQWKFIGAGREPLERLLHKRLKVKPKAEPLLRERISLGEQLYDLENDPGETRNLVDERPGVASALRQRLDVNTVQNAGRHVRLKPPGPDGQVHLTEEEEALLRRLGYLE